MGVKGLWVAQKSLNIPLMLKPYFNWVCTCQSHGKYFDSLSWEKIPNHNFSFWFYIWFQYYILVDKLKYKADSAQIWWVLLLLLHRKYEAKVDTWHISITVGNIFPRYSVLAAIKWQHSHFNFIRNYKSALLLLEEWNRYNRYISQNYKMLANLNGQI